MHAGEEEESLLAPLAHTPATLQRLETLAAGCQSRRTVNLEGDTCSGKTALVMEFARLAGRRLVVVPMTADTGAWRPDALCKCVGTHLLWLWAWRGACQERCRPLRPNGLALVQRRACLGRSGKDGLPMRAALALAGPCVPHGPACLPPACSRPFMAAEVADIIGRWQPVDAQGAGPNLPEQLMDATQQLVRHTLFNVLPACRGTAAAAGGAATGARVAKVLAAVKALLEQPAVAAALVAGSGAAGLARSPTHGPLGGGPGMPSGGTDGDSDSDGRLSSPAAHAAPGFGLAAQLQTVGQAEQLCRMLETVQTAAVLHSAIVRGTHGLQRRLDTISMLLEAEAAVGRGGDGPAADSDGGSAGAGAWGLRQQLQDQQQQQLQDPQQQQQRSPSISFQWVDAPLLRALKNGDWVRAWPAGWEGGPPSPRAEESFVMLTKPACAFSGHCKLRASTWHVQLTMSRMHMPLLLT